MAPPRPPEYLFAATPAMAKQTPSSAARFHDSHTSISGPSTRPATGRERLDAAVATDIEGTVKWFNADKGFGFVVCEDGDKDVFLHISVVERAGLRAVNEGQRLAMKVVKTQKGREAVAFTLMN